MLHTARNARRLVLAFFILMLLWSQLNVFNGLSLEAGETRKMILISLDSVSLNSLNEAKTPNMDYLMNHGTAGLMNTRTAGVRTPLNGFATLGAGNYAVAYREESGIAMKASELYNGEPAGNYILRNTGKQVSDDAIVNVGLAQMVADSFRKNPEVQLGALGTVLKENGIKAAIYGNSDIPNMMQRYLSLIVMDQNGTVAGGNVNKQTIEYDAHSPFGMKTNYSWLIDEYERNKERYGLIGFELGDVSRVEAYKDYVSPDQYARLRIKAIEQADQFIGGLIKHVDFTNTALAIVVPSPTDDAIKEGDMLTPLILSGNGFEKGLAISGSTRRQGIVTNIDLSTTILQYFGLEPSVHMPGREIHAVMQAAPVNVLNELNQDVVSIYNQRRPVLQNFVIVQIIVYLLSLLAIFRFHKIIPYIRYILLWITVMPLTILLLPILHIQSIWLVAIALIFLSILFTVLITKISRNTFHGYTIIYLLTACLLIGDLMTGTHLIKSSLFGYDPIIGARFYGIGNEYMGILLGTTMLGITMYLDRKLKQKQQKLGLQGKIIIGLILAGIIFLMASPKFGANVGGTISAIVAFAFMYMKVIGKRISKKEIMIVIFSVLGVLFAMVVFELTRDVGTQSHIGRAFSAVQKNGPKEIIWIISRKLAMNIKLIRYTSWSWVLMTGMLALAVLFYRPVGLLKNIMASHPYLNCGMIGVITGSIVALCVNDSGIVAAATSITYAVVIIIDLIMKNKLLKDE